MTRRSSRRDFLKQTTLAGVGFWVAGVAGARESKSPNEKLNIAVIGCGGQGASDLGNVSSQNIVALCDVDEKRAAESFNKHPRAKKYKDFRKMLEQQKNIDAVVVATPDNCHAVAGVMAMKLGKHLYCEKPLTHDIAEARVMRETAHKMKVATQMGNQGTAGDTFRRTVEIIRAGELGPVEEVHVWTNRPIWPQGADQPPRNTPPVPPTLAWDLWLGPAHERPYSPDYLPFVWRGWWDFGTGALGDMACHTMNLPYMALKLEAPTSVAAQSSKVNPYTYPTWAKIVYEFPARGDLPEVKLHWYEGHKADKKRVLPPEKLLQGQKISDSGCLIVGQKATLYSADDYGNHNVVLRDGRAEPVKGQPEKLPHSPGHHQEWINACKGGKPAMSNFSYAGRLTETVLLGNLAIRAGKKIEWNSEELRVTNDPAANEYVQRKYRQGWSL
ncbi:MAG: Gfo/Idh/MocA family oxidoreductase [Planctomycetes bacterium]|nr:Gfo/Idh/MocA family oxidoreductase [Planctomycetota bacterium]